MFEELKALIDEPFYFGRERKKKHKNKEGLLVRKIQMTTSSYESFQQIYKINQKTTNKVADKNAEMPVYPYVGYALTDFTRSIQSQQDWVYEKLRGPLATLIQFIKGLRGDQGDLGKKLMSIVNKSKDLKDTEFIEQIENLLTKETN